MTINQKDVGAGISFLSVAVIYGWTATRDLPFGVLLSMGPGYFPMVLCTLLGIIGVSLTVRGLWARQSAELSGHFAWRPVITISLAIILFGTFLRELGLFVSVFCTAFICSIASRQVKWRNALVVAFCLAIICTGVFAYGVRLPLPVLGTWFKG
ncbi:MAG: hypothetical protein K0S56_1676 [Microvirga sp.]|jgi:hypothetical protein|nr:hypothetical protein [Microvirga sp.]